MIESGLAVIIFALGFISSLFCLLLIFWGGLNDRF